MTDYEILGLTSEATPEEIKKAYFELVRKHPPDKDPKGFQEIRAAYERLVSGPPEENESEVTYPTGDYMTDFFVDMIRSAARWGTYSAYEAARDAYYRNTHDTHFQYLLAHFAYRAEKYGVTAKEASELSDMFPKNPKYASLAAKGGYLSGWSKKALTYFQRAYDLNVRGVHFEYYYAACLKKAKKFQDALNIAMGILTRNRRWEKDEMDDLLRFFDLFPGIMKALKDQHLLSETEWSDQLARILNSFCLHVGRYHAHIRNGYAFFLTARQLSDMFEKTDSHYAAFVSKVSDTFHKLDNPVVERDIKEWRTSIFKLDDRLPRLFRTSADFLYDEAQVAKLEIGVLDYYVLDALLCLLFESPTLESARESLSLVRISYPRLSMRIQERGSEIEAADSLESIQRSFLDLYAPAARTWLTDHTVFAANFPDLLKPPVVTKKTKTAGRTRRAGRPHRVDVLPEPA